MNEDEKPKKRGRPKQTHCKRGHDLRIEENVRYTRAKRPCGDGIREYKVRICKLCETIRREAREAKKRA